VNAFKNSAGRGQFFGRHKTEEIHRVMQRRPTCSKILTRYDRNERQLAAEAFLGQKAYRIEIMSGSGNFPIFEESGTGIARRWSRKRICSSYANCI
jgi:hypothetical protein